MFFTKTKKSFSCKKDKSLRKAVKNKSSNNVSNTQSSDQSEYLTERPCGVLKTFSTMFPSTPHDAHKNFPGSSRKAAVSSTPVAGHNGEAAKPSGISKAGLNQEIPDICSFTQARNCLSCKSDKSLKNAAKNKVSSNVSYTLSSRRSENITECPGDLFSDSFARNFPSTPDHIYENSAGPSLEIPGPCAFTQTRNQLQEDKKHQTSSWSQFFGLVEK